MSARIGSSGDESPSFVCVRCFCSSCCFRCSSTQIYERERERGVVQQEVEVMKEWGKKEKDHL